jgi:hypothetical protein
MVLLLRRNRRRALTLALGFFAPLGIEATDSLDTTSAIAMGEDFAVYERVTATVDAIGRPTLTTNRFTLLGNNLHYRENGEWKRSEDLIESFPGGAVARRGPNQAIFATDLNTDAVFDIQMVDGKRLRGGPRGLRLVDTSTGAGMVVATVRESAPGELLPPDRVVYRDAFDGLAADAVCVWRHNQFIQDVVLRHAPPLPDGFNPATTHFEILTEFIEAPEPVVHPKPVEAAGEAVLPDHAVIDFGRLAIVVGHAFPVGEETALAIGVFGPPDDSERTPVRKEWKSVGDGRAYLIESVAWEDVRNYLRLLADVPSKAEDAAGPQVAVAPTWPKRPPVVTRSRPMELAQAPYTPQGYVVDFVTLPNSPLTTTFLSGVTYYLADSYYTGSAVTFQAGTCLKFKNGKYLLLYGPVDFPSGGAKVVFTSRNDNAYGERIVGVAGEIDSNGDPTLHRASCAFWSYYVNFNTTVRNARFRWAAKGIHFDANSGVVVAHQVQDTVFEQSAAGLVNNLPAGATASLSNVKHCSVTTPLSGSGYNTSGTMVEDCGVVSVVRVNDPAQDSSSGDPNKNSQSECSFVVVDSSRIVAAFFDTHHSAYSLVEIPFPGLASVRSTGWAVSIDGGASFVDQGALGPNAPTSRLLKKWRFSGPRCSDDAFSSSYA